MCVWLEEGWKKEMRESALREKEGRKKEMRESAIPSTRIPFYCTKDSGQWATKFFQFSPVNPAKNWPDLWPDLLQKFFYFYSFSFCFPFNQVFNSPYFPLVSFFFKKNCTLNVKHALFQPIVFRNMKLCINITLS